MPRGWAASTSSATRKTETHIWPTIRQGAGGYAAAGLSGAGEEGESVLMAGF
ncbi:hypothetical protein NOK12_24240 [Nocardioides sp. OK12]|nr:hypothetical protein NOK12_24240 [Nocardioides sp. OK12]